MSTNQAACFICAAVVRSFSSISRTSLERIGPRRAAWQVADLDAEVSALRSRGITFERYDMPGVTREGDIHSFGNRRAAWFKDPEGNILNLVT